MKFQNYILGILIVGLLFSCASSSKLSSQGEQKEKLSHIIESKNFEIEVNWALPFTTVSLQNVFNALAPIGSTAGRINLMGFSSFLKMKGDTISANLPYYGERQMGGGYNTRDSGINFETAPDDLKIEYNDEKNRYELSFSAEQGTEDYRVNMVVLPNLNSYINVNSSQRFSIRYEGKIKELREE
ncbi:DUF4251 domain-containing protein [Maribacter aestuarii]|uniref:DUF4251 domain-containing protein n=1 Tax=Maribacter aestuarii TaxID=1130723 RepID=UPI00248D2D9D|nr:DUF4251 domain-containing protein [Maribacter aestuarii]